MRRKLTAALLTAAMAISLTACGGSGDTASAGASTGETASVTEAGGTTTASGKEVLRVAMSADYAPFDWLQEDDSNGAVMTSNGSYMNGYDVLVAKYIAEKLDMDLEITQIDWDGLILSIQSGKVDCAIAGMSITHAGLRPGHRPEDILGHGPADGKKKVRGCGRQGNRRLNKDCRRNRKCNSGGNP